MKPNVHSHLVFIFFLLSVVSISAQGIQPANPAPGNDPAKTAIKENAKPLTTFAALKGPSGIALVRLFEKHNAPGSFPFMVTASGNADMVAVKVISGEFEAAILPVNVAAKLFNSSVPIRLAATTGNGMARFLTNDSAIRSLSDLRNKEIFVAGQGATPDLVFRTILSKAGLKPGRDLHLKYTLSYPEAATALAAGRIKYAILPEPFLTVARLSNPSLSSPFDLDILWKSATGQANYPMTALIVSTRIANEHPEAVKTLLGEVKASIAWVNANPASAGTLVQRHDLGLKAQAATVSIPGSNFMYRTAKESRASVEALLTTFLLLAPESVGGKLPDDAFYLDF